MTDVVPADQRPHRVSALSGVDPAEEPGGIDPANRAQGEGRPDDAEHAELVAKSEAATADAAAAARAGSPLEPDVSYSYTAQVEPEGDVPRTAADVVSWIQSADNSADREARVNAAWTVEYARAEGTRTTVVDELER